MSTLTVLAGWLLCASGCGSGSGNWSDAEEPASLSLCLPATAATTVAFNDRPHLEQDDAGNTLLWWWAADERKRDYNYYDARIQMAAWDGSGFTPARQPDAALEVALRGAGRWLALRTPEDEIQLETWLPDCSRATTTLAPHTAPEVAPSLATNSRGDLVIAWTGVLPDATPEDELHDVGLFVARAPVEGAFTQPQLILQVQNESIPTHIALDAAGGAAVAYPEVELITPELGRYRTAVVASSGGAFSAPTSLTDGWPFAFVSDADGGHLLAIQGSEQRAPTLHLQRFDVARGWLALPDYACQFAVCDVQFGLLRGGSVLIVERTSFNLHAVVVDEGGGLRDDLTFPEFEAGGLILSHALSVAADGTARAIWLTQTAIQTATFSLDAGWSVPTVLLAHAIEKEDFYFMGETGAVFAPQYPMRLVPLAEGRLLAVWSEFSGLARMPGGDSSPLEATEKRLWSLVTDGITASARPVMPE